MSELKKCPFCGGDAWIFKTHEETYAVMHESSDCPITSESFQGNWVYDSLEEAIKAWNTRKPIERVIERLEERIKIYKNTQHNNFPCADVSIKETERIIEIIKEEV